VGHLWINGGCFEGISHREVKPALYAVNQGSGVVILSKFGMSEVKSWYSQT
jgi:hypothetical protein